MSGAGDHRAARRARIGRIRRTVLGAAVAVFIAVFATIADQIATGHDPAQAASSSARQDDDALVSSQPAPLTTSQS